MRTFWMNRGAWQADTSEYVFLANAVMQLGKALYPDEWTGLEPAYEFPVKPVAKRYVFPSEDYKLRVEEKEKDYERRKAEAMKRLVLFQGVMAKIVREAERPNGLQTAYRPKGGYGFKPVPREWWQVSNYPARFEHCQINTAAPGDRAIAGTGPTWAHIFVSKEGLETLISRLSCPEAPERPTPAHRSDTPPQAAHFGSNDNVELHVPSRPDEAKCMELAAQLDAEGVPKREVKASMIASRWNLADGPTPKKEAITGLMVGQSKGRPANA